MERFRFRLQTVANVRQIEEDRRKEQLAEATRQLILEQEQFRCLAQERELCEYQLRFSRGERLFVPDVCIVAAYLARLDMELGFQHERIESARTEVESRRELLVKASRDRKVLGRLREKRFLDYRREANREEQIFLDEIAGRSAQSGRNTF